MPAKLFWMATAAPERPAISAWLSLVGMPKYHAAVAQITMAAMAAQRAIKDRCAFSPKSTMLYMVMATEALIAVMTKTPRKLKIAAMIMAFRTPIAFVETQVAIALGASVQPLTNMTPSVRMVEMSSMGLPSI